MQTTRNLEAVRKAFDAEWSRKYRQLDDQVAKTGESYRHYALLVEQLSASFGRPIVALDLGCGTGRHFCCLQNVERLVAMDLSEDMLEQARHPLFADKITVGSIEYLAGDVFSSDLREGTFDLIYSIGVLGEYVPLDAATLERLYALLRPGGVAFFTVTDSRSRISEPENAQPSFVRRVLRKSFPILPEIVRELLNRYYSPSYTTPARMHRLLRESPFARYTMEPYVHLTGWRGTNLDCTVFRAAGPGLTASSTGRDS
jgi:SAM-dependent methyltransferase